MLEVALCRLPILNLGSVLFNNNNNNNNNLNYKDLTIEIERMWNVKTTVIPVIIGATAIISKSFIKYVSIIPGSHEVRFHPFNRPRRPLGRIEV
jgi:hypothetical protein